MNKVEAPAEEECDSESVAVLTLRGKSRIDGNSEEEDAAAIDIFSFYWPRDVVVTTHECQSQLDRHVTPNPSLTFLNNSAPHFCSFRNVFGRHQTVLCQ